MVGGHIAGTSDPSFILVQPEDGARLLFYGPDLAASAILMGLVYAESDR